MAVTISSNSWMAGNLFSSMNSNLVKNSSSSSFSGVGLMSSFSLADYASIRNGSYHKLLSSYYSMESSNSVKGTGSAGASSSSRTYNYWTPDGMIQRTYGDTKTGTSSTSTSKESSSKLATIESNAEKFSDAADALLTQGTKSLFKQVTTTNSDGTKTTGYNTDAIYKAVSSYVDQYNNLIKSASGSSVMAIRTSAASMADYSKANAKALSSIGITINSDDNTLSLDEETFKNADMATVKSLFQGTGSYAYQESAKASVIDYHAQYEAQKANTYNSGGVYSYNYSSGSLWNGMV